MLPLQQKCFFVAANVVVVVASIRRSNIFLMRWLKKAFFGYWPKYAGKMHRTHTHTVAQALASACESHVCMHVYVCGMYLQSINALSCQLCRLSAGDVLIVMTAHWTIGREAAFIAAATATINSIVVVVVVTAGCCCFYFFCLPQLRV